MNSGQGWGGYPHPSPLNPYFSLRYEVAMLTSIYSTLNRFGAGIDRVIAWLVGAIVLLMFSSLFLQVISRYCFGSPLSWPEEVTMFLMAWMSFLGASVALRGWGHIGVDFFLKKFSGRIYVCLQLLVHLIILIFALFLFVEGCIYVAKSGNFVSDGLRISMAYPRLSMPIGGSLMTLHSIVFILGDLLQLQMKKEAEHAQ
jgi:TRAP-type C4-dicarboxylate transport system permease small subunit